MRLNLVADIGTVVEPDRGSNGSTDSRTIADAYYRSNFNTDLDAERSPDNYAHCHPDTLTNCTTDIDAYAYTIERPDDRANISADRWPES